METLRQRTISTDVLVIGAGGAGIRTAIEARNLGAKILVVSKGDYPSGCITAIAMGCASSASFINHYKKNIDSLANC
jgi:succinate dehydrogenase/fumarate reductase flavoprotein subunit